jgi:tRNA-uridine 2-sulfurtransferase
MTRVAVGMSGGIDSSVAALLLKKAGHDVVGLTMKLWAGEAAGAGDGGGGPKSACYGPDELEDIEAARDVCSRLGIPFHVLDCSAAYGDAVLRYVREGYLGGRTPNPCVRCNPAVKFGVLPALAREAGIDFEFFATGHYARIEYDHGRKRYLLKKGLDPEKDQSYFLYRLTQAQLASTIFPLGGLIKDRVRKIARETGLPVHEKKDSQDFYSGDIGDIIGREDEEGDIVDREGRVLGRHCGVWRYTIGQRRGLGIAHPVPLYVVAIDAARNRLVVGPESETFSRSFVAGECAWGMVEDLKESAEVRVKVRSTSRPVGAVVSPRPGGRVAVALREPVSAVAPGQSAVFYVDDAVFGGGVIESAV